jgi:hypothetical protein
LVEGTGANPRVAELPPASKVVVGPKSEVAHLPAASAFRPGSPGDIQVAKAPGGVAGRPGEAGGTGSALQSGGRGRWRSSSGGGSDDEISELQERIDRLLLIFAADHPDVVALQRRIDQLYAERGPLSRLELSRRYGTRPSRREHASHRRRAAPEGALARARRSSLANSHGPGCAAVLAHRDEHGIGVAAELRTTLVRRIQPAGSALPRATILHRGPEAPLLCRPNHPSSR